ncbi:MAG: 4Fe-4S dicluster domain-containing protein [Dehalococcoidia bacterium]|jgi:heterodisulfide reductase subunit C
MAEQARLIDIYIMGRHCEVPEGLTILTAMEYSGYTMIRGCGCRAGFCGACATIYNFKNDPQLRYDLACQKTVEQDMVIVQVPFFPSVKSIYDLDKIQADGDTVLKLYPDIVKCFGCNTCTKTCPQELEVMWFMSDALRGDIAAAADKSFDCLMCGLCAARCPQGLVPYNVAILCRRLYGHNLAPVSQHLLDRIAEIEAGEFDSELNKLIKANQKELSRLYAERDIESALEQAWE